MADFKTVWNETNQYCDFELETINNGATDVDVETGNDLISAVLISLMCDRVADEDWSYSLDKRGWWADVYNERTIGSRLWQLSYLPVTDPDLYLSTARAYVIEALTWLVDDNVAKEIDCVASFVDTKRTNLNLDITITKADNSILKYAYVWSMT